MYFFLLFVGYCVTGSCCIIPWMRLLFLECFTPWQTNLVMTSTVLSLSRPPNGCCYFCLAEVWIGLKGFSNGIHLLVSSFLEVWIRSKGFMRVMSLLVWVKLKGLSRVMSLPMSPLLEVQTELKGLTIVIPIFFSILMSIPLSTVHSLVFAQCLKDRDICNPFRIINTHFLFVVYSFAVVFLVWICCWNFTPIKLFISIACTPFLF